MSVRHFSFLAPDDEARLFHRPPSVIPADADPQLLAVALGATLYLPGTRPRLADDLRRQARAGVTSAVICLEDAIGDADVPAAEANVVQQVGELADGGAQPPLLFVRVRSVEQLQRVVAGLGPHLAALTGFVVPKFTAASGAPYLAEIERTAARTGQRLFAMPILESHEVVHRETRTEALVDVHALLAAHRDRILAVRVGTTDLCSVYGIRRTPDLTVYDVHVIAQVLADVVNVLGRADGTGFVVSGPVWEYFGDDERLFKPLLRESPFRVAVGRGVRDRLITSHLDGLVREVVLDRANGMTGKTVIHPSHVPPVHALSVVSHEEYLDAVDILGEPMRGGGVMASGYRNKMNESKPHRAWATLTLRRAQVFGVANDDITFAELLAACLP